MSLDRVGPELQVRGTACNTIYAGFGPYRAVASRFLLEHGLGEVGPDRKARLDLRAWYPLAPLLDALASVLEEVGEQAAFQAGLAVPDNAVFAPGVRDLASALDAVNASYHLNHRRGGRVMFDLRTGEVLEGIGHYRIERLGPARRLVTSDTPYPCDYEQGLLRAFVERFERCGRPSVAHAETSGCRRRGDRACAYVVGW